MHVLVQGPTRIQWTKSRVCGGLSTIEIIADRTRKRLRRKGGNKIRMRMKEENASGVAREWFGKLDTSG